MEILKVENLIKTYGKGENLVNAVDDVSFTVGKGEFISIVGQSGSGKSTLLHMIGGVDIPTSGRIIVNNENICDKNMEEMAIYRRRQVGLVYQFYNLIPILNVVENITLPLKLEGKKVDQEYLDELINILGLEDRRKNLPKQLSGGQQQRVAIARALINRPSLILADEPTGNLDSNNSSEVIDIMKKSNEKYGQTILIITHDEGIAAQTGRMIRMQDGKIITDVKQN